MENKIGKNRRSPANEAMYIQEYLKQNPRAKRDDGQDVSAVITKNGVKGHGLLSEEVNRSHDTKNHIVKDFISDDVLKQKMRK